MEPSQFRKPKGASRAATPPTSTTSTTEEAKGATSKSKRKIASNNDGESAERIRNMPGLWNSFLDNVWEGDDFEESLLTLEGMIGSLFLTSISHIRQLLALALSPTSCLQLPKTHTKYLVLSTNSDPFLPTSRKIRSQAIRLLEEISTLNGSEVLFRACPGYGEDSSVDSSFLPPSTTSASSKGNRRSSPEDSDLEEEDSDPFYLAGKRISRCEDLWDFLAGVVVNREEGITLRNREEPIYFEGGWELLRCLVGIWEEEGRVRQGKGGSNIAASLLRQFKPTIRGPREASSKIIDIIFWPYTHSDPSSDDSDEEEEQGLMDIAEKRQISSRLIGLVARLVIQGNLEVESFEREILMALKRLPEGAFTDFLENLQYSPPLFIVRLCTLYLELNSHNNSSSSNPNHPVHVNASPRRKLLGPSGSNPNLLAAAGTTSSSGLNSSQTVPQSSDPSSQLSITPVVAPINPNPNSEFFHSSPNISNILNLCSKIPSVFPLPTAPSTPEIAVVISTPVKKGGKRQPKSRTGSLAINTKATKAVVEKNLRIFEMIKIILCENVWSLLEENGKEKLANFQEKVQEKKEVMEKVLREGGF